MAAFSSYPLPPPPPFPLKTALAAAETSRLQAEKLKALGWVLPNGTRQDLRTLLGLPSFVLQLGVAKRIEVSGLRTAVVVTVCELSALELLINQRGQRSLNNAPNKKNALARTRFRKTICELLHSLAKWEAWTATPTFVGLSSTPARPTDAEIDAVKKENYPWGPDAGRADSTFEGMRPMLDTYRVVSAKLARVLKELRDLPIKFERVYHFYRNLRLRISQCCDRKAASLAVVEADIVAIRLALAEAPHASTCRAGAPCAVGCLKGEALKARGLKVAEALRLRGEIEILRSHLEQANKDAAPFDARAVGARWVPEVGETAGADARWLPEAGDAEDSDSDSDSDDYYGDEPRGDSGEGYL